MDRHVDIRFDCLPLRSVANLEIPADGSPKFRSKCQRMKDAMEKHGRHNTYYLHNATCAFFFTNREDTGMVEFEFEGTVFTDNADQKTQHCDLRITMTRETCEWLTAPVLEWLTETVRRAVAVEFDRYIAAGDLERTKRRLDELQAEMEKSGGYVGMYL